MSTSQFDIIIIGAGPGGYVAALRAAQLGRTVALIDRRADLGGTCLNVGCIPSKALLHISGEYQRLAALVGVELAQKTFPLSAVHRHRTQTVAGLRAGVKGLVSKRGITFVQGSAVIQAPGVVQVGQVTYRAGAIIIATGSKAASLPALPFNGTTVVSSDEAIAFDPIPQNLVVIGGGAIGLELGQVWARMGSTVTVLESLPQIAPGYDADVAAVLEKSLAKDGLKIFTSTRFVDYTGGVVHAQREGEPLQWPADRVLVAVGRVPVTDGLGLQELGIRMTPRGRIQVDPHTFQTSIPGIYAIGDVIDGPMLAHRAEEDGVALAQMLSGHRAHVNYALVPGVIYTHPEVAIVGATERALNDAGTPFKVGRFPFMANGRALASSDSTGFVKVLAHAHTDAILGVQIVCSAASEMIATAAAHMTYGASAQDLASTCFAHPTLSEALKEAAMAVDKRAIHMA